MAATRDARTPPLHGVDAVAMRFLDLHEAKAHALGGREVRDLGDAVLLHDALDPEPFWNRIAALRWPDDPSGFDRRLGEALTLFASLGRQPHLWLSPAHNQPIDIGARLEEHGFIDVGGGHLMILLDARASLAEADRDPLPGVSVERVEGGTEPAENFVDEVGLVLGEAFDVPRERHGPISAELARAMRSPELSVYVARFDGVPVAVAKRTTMDGASYLSSIGVRPAWQGRGLGALVTAAAVRDAQIAGSRWTYLGVFSDNLRAQRLYRRLGFATVGGRAGDFLLR